MVTSALEKRLEVVEPIDSSVTNLKAAIQTLLYLKLERKNEYR